MSSRTRMRPPTREEEKRSHQDVLFVHEGEESPTFYGNEMVHPEQDDLDNSRKERVMSTDSVFSKMSEAYPDEPLDMLHVDTTEHTERPTEVMTVTEEQKAASPRSQKPARRAASFTREYVPYFAAPENVARPRGHQLSVGGTGDRHSTFTTRAHRTRVYRSWCSRVTYTFLLLNMTVWVPLWLKLLMIERNETQSSRPLTVYNSSVSIDLKVSTFEDKDTECGKCDAASENGLFGYTYPIDATVENFHRVENVPTATYVTLLASYNFKDWFVVNQAGDLTGLRAGSNDVAVCRADPFPEETDDDPATAEQAALQQQQQTEDELAREARQNAEKTEFESVLKVDPVTGEVIDRYDQILQTKTTVAPTLFADKATDAPTPLDFDDEQISRCCLDKPGFVYFVACATPYEYLQKADIYERVEGPPFEEKCIALTGRCGVSCGIEADAPVEETCVDGRIPLDKLLSDRFLETEDDDGQEERRRHLLGNDRRHFDRSRRMTSLRSRLYHASFIFFVTLTTIGTWISFFAGTGMLEEPLKPSMTEVEAYMSDTTTNVHQNADVGGGKKKNRRNYPVHKTQKKPLCLCAFGISATEPRMMVLRNFCGKLMSWLSQRKFTLGMRSVDKASIFDRDPQRQTVKAKSARELKAATMDSYVECIDIFQDEGHRVGAYALWDSFVDLVHDSDLRFIEAMAAKMSTMKADDDRLLGKEADDGLLLDDELRALAKDEQGMDIKQDHVDRLELAFATFDLLSALGHHAFWRNDGKTIGVVQFRDLANDAYASAGLKQWAANFKEEKKRSGNPFAADVAPTSVEGIAKETWQSWMTAWWELYDSLGRNQWVKRFDCTKFRLIRLHYDRQANGGHHRDLMMCYAARANPEDLRIKLAPTTNTRGISKNVFVRLKHAEEKNDKHLIRRFKRHEIRPLSRSEARRAHARVVAQIRLNGVSYVKVKECTPELLTHLPNRLLVNAGADEDDVEMMKADYESPGGQLLRNYRSASNRALCARPKHHFQGEEAILPLELVEPLRQSRGKSGGMNHAMEILNYYIRHHSSTMSVVRENAEANHEEFWSESAHGKNRGGNVPTRNQKNVLLSTNLGRSSRRGLASTTAKQQFYDDVPPDKRSNPVAACLLFAIFDCRHMATQGFWDAVIPYFYAYKHIHNPWSRELQVDRPVAFVQLPQSFNSLTLDNDIFDMRNEYLFRFANNIRSGVGAITSCGTNAVWNYDIKFQATPLEHRFNEDTMIEDTASSHDVIIAGRKGVYHFERLVLGARKGTNDYLAAVFRWSRGAVQLFWTTFWFPRYRYVWPWVVVVIHALPTIACVYYLQTVKLDECHRTALSTRFGAAPCHAGPVSGLVLDPAFLIYVVFMATLATGSFHYHRMGAYTVMLENVSYYFTSLSAFYWTALPPYMCIARHSVPDIFDVQMLTAGALWLQGHMALILQIIKAWSPLENGNAPSDQSLLRAQQMYFLSAPLHVLAIVFGMKDGFDILFRRKDASRWSSFDSIMALTTVKLWVIGLVLTMLVAIGWGIYNVVVYDDTTEEKGVRALGMFFCVLILFIIETPFRGMYFYNRVVKSKEKPNCLDRLTKSIFGKKQPIRPDYIYLLLWMILLIFLFRRSNKSDGILNGRSRCSINPDEDGCEEEELFKFVRLPGEGLLS
eukprot:CAMPEP_0198653902 /NCGR_PEP_ID=MMETSP1467-20131203/7348_1 /TAXON_ID=1462469 /ORGANISM="unid. sp., Strain CCMP2135" /LENGTH=1651 /DNA_ID=CAMNT_0044389879 /DNA_START=6 /DNA_END=4961 /DNA_ORIENTATION=+